MDIITTRKNEYTMQTRCWERRSRKNAREAKNFSPALALEHKQTLILEDQNVQREGNELNTEKVTIISLERPTDFLTYALSPN